MQSNTHVVRLGRDDFDPDGSLKRRYYVRKRDAKRKSQRRKRSILLGHETAVAGEVAERYFMELVTRIDLPPWIKGFRKASSHQDIAEATDALAILVNEGRVRIQIKSSMTGLREFNREHPRSNIVCIVIDYNQCHEELKRIIVEKIRTVAFRLHPELFR